ncbi:MAG: sensor histidine kinase [Methylobacteriaceae bacterium]|jgi:two-component system cell cycle sensor histidine kinase PleC|uniref:histidine kinase n=5 Tax=Methylorubrum extorquens TaxID=408 RepID=C5AVE4_METEA|nr:MULTISPECIES: HAMP domain-containing sensor histidine kinase [Methylobacteriaceae]KQO80644.1 ATPase [Methylobacterium sp. Leaf90]KQP00089.1 ATPase [Methylobacterium sp. Leaf92]KQP89480.1 ATPase [Methylobacterium sp. Leaf119]KQQ12291.1 ATPase [Methylobacterium sp. Leaf121]MBA9071267.1 two-component system cell cycle sensor histidine kinase PleC [Methylobacterium sp. RAS18]MDF9861831.1 two-component system cell cycle sensor histidine kinase PleC [Methylorubrum pseudosasae]MDH6635452.1 two-c
MADLTAEMVQRGRGPSSQEVAKRRGIAREMRSARERLTSTSGLERAFDTELLRLYAQYRVGAGIPLLILALMVAGASSIWVPAVTAAIWAAGAIAATTLMLLLSRRFLRQAPESLSLKHWGRAFVAAEFGQSAAWAMLLLVGVPEARTFALFGLVIVAAVTTMLAATVPVAALAGLVPLMLAALSLLIFSSDMDTMLLVAMTVASQLFFAGLARRLYASAVGTLQSRAEKDAIFAELEQAKANSDEARRRAEEANLAKSRFLATMSHELRTPLNAILGFSEVMKNEVFGAHVAPAYREYATDIHDSGMHLLNLINEILDLSRIEAGRYDLTEEAVQLAHTVEECRHMMTLRARSKGQTFASLIDDSLPRLWADERALRQIVLNLLSNAVKFTPPGGEITIKVGWTSSGGQYLSVKDSGPGIPEDELGTVMSSFGRGSLAIKTAEQGSGLGLPIVKGLIDLHGGGFQLKSKPREGTEVIVTFPASRGMDTLPAMTLAAEKAPAEAASARRARAA